MDLGTIGYAFINTAGVGGAVVIVVYGTACVVYYVLTRWILYGGRHEKHE
jgi:hypothetical protein